MNSDQIGPFEQAENAAEVLKELFAGFDSLVVLGSGWGDAARSIGRPIKEVSYDQLPGFPRPTVHGHSGTASLIELDDHRVLMLAGRSHLYEGLPASRVVHPVRCAVIAGAKRVVLTNAAGGLDTANPVGTPVLLSDQLNLTGATPMEGQDPPEKYGSRFCDLTDLYSEVIRTKILDQHHIPQGVYAGMLGGAYETPAEIRMLASFGATVVGMSTVLEAIAAKHLGAEVVGVSLVTNLAAGLSADGLSHSEVLEAGKAGASHMARIIETAVTV